jgi:hypothetical protein
LIYSSNRSLVGQRDIKQLAAFAIITTGVGFRKHTTKSRRCWNFWNTRSATVSAGTEKAKISFLVAQLILMNALSVSSTSLHHNKGMSPKDLVYYESVDNSESSPPESQQQSRFQVQPLKKIRFNEHARVHYLSADETESRTQHKSDIWYMRSDLMTMRKNDRQTLLLALRSVAARAQERVSTQLHPGVTSSMDGSSASPPISPSEFEAPAEFCFRGMEIILYKKEREESRRRAIQAVLSEQHSQRIKENNRKQKGLVILETPKLRSQQRISDEYRLATRKAYDEAYLRGLGDAQELEPFFNRAFCFLSHLRGSAKRR